MLTFSDFVRRYSRIVFVLLHKLQILLLLVRMFQFGLKCRIELNYIVCSLTSALTIRDALNRV